MPRSDGADGPFGRWSTRALKLVPWPWRQAVQRDLVDEAADQPEPVRDFWGAWHIVRIAARFHVRYARRAMSRARPLAGFWTDFHLAFRTLLREHGSTITIATTLALGIGATTATYAVFNFLLFRPVPGVPTEQPLVTIMFQPPTNLRMSAFGSRSALPDMRSSATSLEALGFSSADTLAVGVPAGQPTFENGRFVSSQYFTALGVRPRLGRLLSDEEAETNDGHPVVISERLWRAKFAGLAGATGQTLVVNRHPFVVVGVMDGFRGWGSTRVGDTDLWLPLGAEKLVLGATRDSIETMAGRLRGDTSIAVVQDQIRAGYEPTRLTLARTGGHSAFVPVVYPGLYHFQAADLREQALRLYWLLMAGVTLLFAVASANAANLLLARMARRERDIAVRLAIGGSRSRIIRQILIEVVALSAMAGGLGLILAKALVNSFEGMSLFSWDLPLRDLAIDIRVVTFCIGMSVATVVVFGLLPAILGSRADIRAVLGRGGRSVTSHHRFRGTLVTVQVALALTLSVGAGVLNRSLQNLFSTDLGLNPEGVIEVSLRPQFTGRGERESNRIVDTVIDALGQAGLGPVATASPDALTDNGSRIRVTAAETPAPEEHSVVPLGVSPQYFELLRMPLSGRAFTDEEHRGAQNVRPMPIIINRTLARDIFRTDAVSGRTIDLSIDNEPAVPAVVVGVVGDTRSSAVRPEPRAKLYYAGASFIWRFRTILVRSNESPTVAIERIRQVIHQVDPALPITRLRPLADEIKESLSEDRVLARLSALVGFMALLLAASGVFAVISQFVAERRRDFGIRTALGASPRQILQFVLGGVLVRTGLGAAIGVGLYWLSARWLESRLFGVLPLDAATLVAAVATLVAVAVVAAYFPARRATEIDPAEALRTE